MAVKAAVQAAAEKQTGAGRIGIRIPKTENEDTTLGGAQYEHVTINGKTTMIRCGDYVEVTPAVFEVLKTKYPNL